LPLIHLSLWWSQFQFGVYLGLLYFIYLFLCILIFFVFVVLELLECLLYVLIDHV
jgi:hypothetical protein